MFKETTHLVFKPKNVKCLFFSPLIVFKCKHICIRISPYSFKFDGNEFVLTEIFKQFIFLDLVHFLLKKIVGNNKIDDYVGQVRLSKG